MPVNVEMFSSVLFFAASISQFAVSKTETFIETQIYTPNLQYSNVYNLNFLIRNNFISLASFRDSVPQYSCFLTKSIDSRTKWNLFLPKIASLSFSPNYPYFSYLKSQFPRSINCNYYFKIPFDFV